MHHLTDLTVETLGLILSYAGSWFDVLCVVHRTEYEGFNLEEDPALYTGGWTTVLIKIEGKCKVLIYHELLNILKLVKAQALLGMPAGRTESIGADAEGILAE